MRSTVDETIVVWIPGTLPVLYHQALAGCLRDFDGLTYSYYNVPLIALQRYLKVHLHHQNIGRQNFKDRVAFFMKRWSTN